MTIVVTQIPCCCEGASSSGSVSGGGECASCTFPGTLFATFENDICFDTVAEGCPTSSVFTCPFDEGEQAWLSEVRLCTVTIQLKFRCLDGLLEGNLYCNGIATETNPHQAESGTIVCDESGNFMSANFLFPTAFIACEPCDRGDAFITLSS